MQIGEEDKPYIAEPIEDPFRRRTPAPEREPAPLPSPAPPEKVPERTPEKVPA